MKYYIGIDLGGTNIKAGVVNENFEIIAKATTKTLCPRPAKEICDDMAKAKAPKNEAENACFMELSALGWTATKRGWPDFFCVRNGEIMAVEVKPRKGHPLKANQAVIMGLLADHGIPCYLWTPDGGLERMNGTE